MSVGGTATHGVHSVSLPEHNLPPASLICFPYVALN